MSEDEQTPATTGEWGSPDPSDPTAYDRAYGIVALVGVSCWVVSEYMAHLVAGRHPLLLAHVAETLHLVATLALVAVVVRVVVVTSRPRG